MKRTVPLLITALGGFVLIVAFFIPAYEGWGEVAAVWFDVLAAIAFVLGGGNLLKIHLKKTSDRAPGWGYSVVTLLAFLTMLTVGLLKIGSPPAEKQEYYGETFASLPLEALPDAAVATIPGRIPVRAYDEQLPPSVRRQVSQDPEAGTISFRGWMRGNQRNDLQEYKDELEWRCTVERLFQASRPPDLLRGKLNYYDDHGALSFKGAMAAEHRDALLAMGNDPQWTDAVSDLYDRSQRVVTVPVQSWPAAVEVPGSLKDVLTYDASSGAMTLVGPMSAEQRDALTSQFSVARPLDADRRQALLTVLRALGPVTSEQEQALHKVLDGSWTVPLLAILLNEAGRGEGEDKTACEMLDEQRAGVTPIDPRHPAPPDETLNAAQLGLLEQFAGDQSMRVADLAARLAQAGPFTGKQAEALQSFMSRSLTAGQRYKTVALVMMREGPLNSPQRDLLLRGYREQIGWRQTVGELFVAAHQVKYPWSGAYRAQGSPFWWLYEYAFKPLTATMFAMLAFYVASAAFRAFRAKNIEAILLLGTAFIILLGRTFAGVWLTAWLPDSLAGLRIENLTVTIMSVFNTAGNRAIMIGIALGIASTSLKVLLGVDRSYLGKE